MGALLTALAAWLGPLLAALLTGFRTWILGFLIKIVLVVILYNVFAEFLGDILSWVLAKISSVGMPGGVITNFDVGSVSSLGAWLVVKTRVPECVSIMVAAISTKWLLGRIPFFGR